MKLTSFLLACVSLGGAASARADWKADQVADVMKCAPPAVTKDAKIWGWEKTKRVLVRDGSGPYNCIASGSYSIRLGKPALPYPDSLCADANAWSFFTAIWEEADPIHPKKAYPTAPGLVWMLAGMDVVKGKVAYGKGTTVATGHEAMHGAGAAKEDIVDMTPHIMILPLPVSAHDSGLSGVYDEKNPLQMWVMAPYSPLTHLHVHFPEPVVKAMMAGVAGAAPPAPATPAK